MSTSIMLDKPLRQNFVSSFFQNQLKENLPRKLKRLIFLASLFAMIKDIKNPSDEILRKLDKMFQLTNRSELAMGMPMYVHSLIWERPVYYSLDLKDNCRGRFNDIIADQLYRGEFIALSDYFYSITPSWLKYGTKELMQNDLVKLFKNLNQIAAA